MGERRCVRYSDRGVGKVALSITVNCWEVRPQTKGIGDPRTWDIAWQQIEGEEITEEEANELSGYYMTPEEVTEEIALLLRRVRN